MSVIGVEFKQRYLQEYLRQFYIERIDRRIWDRLKGLSFLVNQNIILNMLPRFNLIRSAVTTILLNQRERIDFDYISLGGLIFSLYRTDESNTPSLEDLIDRKRLLIVYELQDFNNKLYPELLSQVVNSRIIQNKYNLLIFTSRRAVDLLGEERVSNDFLYIDLSNIDINNKSRSDIY